MSQYQDSNLYLVFPDLNSAITANKKIYENYARSTAPSRGGNLFNQDIQQNVAESSIPSGEVVPTVYSVLATKNGVEQTDTGLTTGWGNIHQREDDPTSYVLSKPINDYMTGVTGFTSTEARNPAWYPTLEE